MKTHLKYALQLKTKEDVEGRGWRLQRGRRKLTWRWKNKCLVKKKKKSLLDHAKTMGHRVDLNL